MRKTLGLLLFRENENFKQLKQKQDEVKNVVELKSELMHFSLTESSFPLNSTIIFFPLRGQTHLFSGTKELRLRKIFEEIALKLAWEKF